MIAVAYPDGRPFCVEGVLDGGSHCARAGDQGFGYDPVFVPDDADGRTLAEMTPRRRTTCRTAPAPCARRPKNSPGDKSVHADFTLGWRREGPELPMFPLGMVIFPHQVVGLCVFEARYHQMLRDIETDQRFGTCLIARGSEVGGYDERTSVGTLMQILGAQSLPNGQTLVMAEGVECFEVASGSTTIPIRVRS